MDTIELYNQIFDADVILEHLSLNNSFSTMPKHFAASVNINFSNEKNNFLCNIKLSYFDGDDSELTDLEKLPEKQRDDELKERLQSKEFIVIEVMYRISLSGDSNVYETLPKDKIWNIIWKRLYSSASNDLSYLCNKVNVKLIGIYKELDGEE